MTDRDIPASVFHYTSAQGLMGILGARKIWLTDIGFLNDDEEMKFAARTLADGFERVLFDEFGASRPDPEGPMLHRYLVTAIHVLHATYGLEPSERLRNRFGGGIQRHEQLWERLPFVACFCSDGDLLSMWRGYANGSGFAIEFDTKVLQDVVDNGVDHYNLTDDERKSLLDNNFGLQARFAAVSYGDERVKAAIEGALREMSESTNDHVGVAADHLLSSMIPMLAGTKHPAFREEQVVRLMAFPTGDLSPRLMMRAGASHLVPYFALEFPHAAIRSIRVGPAAQRERSRDALHKFLHFRPRGEYEHVRLDVSKTPLV